MNHTQNLGIPLIDENTDKTTKDWALELNGQDPSSMANIVDREIKDLKVDMAALDSTISKINAKDMEQDSVISELYAAVGSNVYLAMFGRTPFKDLVQAYNKGLPIILLEHVERDTNIFLVSDVAISGSGPTQFIFERVTSDGSTKAVIYSEEFPTGASRIFSSKLQAKQMIVFVTDNGDGTLSAGGKTGKEVSYKDVESAYAQEKNVVLEFNNIQYRLLRKSGGASPDFIFTAYVDGAERWLIWHVVDGTAKLEYSERPAKEIDAAGVAAAVPAGLPAETEGNVQAVLDGQSEQIRELSSKGTEQDAAIRELSSKGTEQDAAIRELSAKKIDEAVYYGPTPPADTRKLWVKTDVKPKNGKYELIEEFTHNGDNPLIKEAEPDGTPYNFSACVLKAKVPASDTPSSVKNMSLRSDTTILCGGYINAPAKSVQGNIYLKSEIRHGVWESEFTKTPSEQYSYTNVVKQGADYFMSRTEEKFPRVNHIEAQALPAGTFVQIYGVRK